MTEPAAIASTVRPVATLTASERQQLFELMSAHFENVDQTQFFRDLDEKRSVVLLVDSEQDRICGFSALTLRETIIDGEPVSAVFAGDTVIEPDYWGQHSWLLNWGRHAFELADLAAHQPVYFLLLTATHRSYRFLPGLFHEYYPRPDRPTPPAMQARIDALSRLRFPDEYDALRGIVSLHHPTPVRAERADPAAQQRMDEDVQFFLSRNPGYQNGDYLACITILAADNMTRVGRRVVGLDPQ